MVSNHRVKALLDAVPSGTKILDIGCVQHSADRASDEDWVHAKLYDIGETVVGVDYLKSDVETLRNRGYNVVHADAENLDLGEQFEVIVAGELIEHLSNIGEFLDGARSHLTDDGRLVLTTPNPWAFHRFKQAASGNVAANSEHTCWLDERTLRQTLVRHRFNVKRIEYIKASDFGITSVLYDLGFHMLGGTSLLVVAQPMQ